MSHVEERLNELQNEYQEIILGMKKDGTPIENETDNYVYNWTRLKELQIMIHHNIRRVRKKELRTARCVEEKFTRVEEEVER